MNILHFADIHIGLSVDEKDYGKGDTNRITEIKNILHEVALKSKGTDIVVIPGDVFTFSFPSPYLVGIFQDFVYEVKSINPNVVFLMINGNHDFSNVNQHSALESVEKARIPGVIIANTLQNYLIGTDLNFIMLPFVGKYYDISKVNDDIKSLIVKGKKNILVGHFTYVGIEASYEKMLMRDGWNVSEKIDGIDLFILGHIHQYQIADNNVVYSGSPVQIDVGERDSKKGFVTIDTNTMKITFNELNSYLKYKLLEYDKMPTKEDIESQNITSNDIVVVRIKLRREQAYNLSLIEHALSQASNYRIETNFTDTVQVRNSEITETISPMDALKKKVKADKPEYAKEILEEGQVIFDDIII